jgi:hypothetical protein
MLDWYKTPWRLSKKNETRQSINGLYVKVHISMSVNLLVLSIKLTI